MVRAVPPPVSGLFRSQVAGRQRRGDRGQPRARQSCDLGVEQSAVGAEVRQYPPHRDHHLRGGETPRTSLMCAGTHMTSCRVGFPHPTRPRLRPCAPATSRTSQPRAPDSPGHGQLAVAAGVFALLSAPTRLRLLWTLAGGEADVSQLTEACGASRTARSPRTRPNCAWPVWWSPASSPGTSSTGCATATCTAWYRRNSTTSSPASPSTTAPTSDGARHCPVCATDTPLPTADGTRPHDAPHERPLSAPSPRPVSATTRRPPCSPACCRTAVRTDQHRRAVAGPDTPVRDAPGPDTVIVTLPHRRPAPALPPRDPRPRGRPRLPHSGVDASAPCPAHSGCWCAGSGRDGAAAGR